MQAAVFREFGAPDVLRLEDVPEPVAAPGQVLVKVLAAGVNRLDHYIREGSVAPDLPLPHVLGVDIAGVVEALGDGASGFEIGDRVLVAPGYVDDDADTSVYPASLAASYVLPGLGRWGGYAQYISVPVRGLVRDDTDLTPAQAAALPVVLASSVRALKEVGQVKPGDRVLVHAGSSGSGSMQIQVARALGAEVATTVRSAGKRGLARDLGAELVIDPAEDVVAAVQGWTGGKGADVVIDNLGGDMLRHSINATKAAGTVVVYGFAAGAEATVDVRDIFFAQRRLLGTMAADPSDLVWGLEQVRAGRIRPVVDDALPLAKAGEAHQRLVDHNVQGNLVLLPWAA